MMMLNKALLLLLCDAILDDLCSKYEAKKENICTYNGTTKEKEYTWHGSKSLFGFFAWYVSKIGEANGLHFYRGTKQIDILFFQDLIANEINIDRRAFCELFDVGTYPQNHELIIKYVNKHISGIINHEIKPL